MITSILSQITELFILMAMGFVSFKLKIITKEASSYFSSLVLKIALPCLIINSFIRPFSRELLGELAITLGVAFAVYGFCLFFCLVYPMMLRIRGPERGIHRYALFISNSGFFSYPVTEAILGPFYLFHASVFNIPSNILAFSIGAWLVAKGAGKAPVFSWKVFLTPQTAATIIGFAIFVFSITPPEPLVQSIRMVANITTPLSMTIIGISIAQADVKQILGCWRVYATAFTRLLVIPAFVFFACYLAGIRGPLLMLSVIIAAMPAGSSTATLAVIYDAAVEEAGSIVALSLILSAVTIPLMVIAVQLLGS